MAYFSNGSEGEDKKEVMEDKLWKDTIHGFTAKCRSKSMAWSLIRNKCHAFNLEVPTLDKIVEFY